VPLSPAATAETKLNDVTAMSPAASGIRRCRISEIGSMKIDLTAGTATLGDTRQAYARASVFDFLFC